MATVHHLSPQDARRVAVRAQFLERERPADLMSAVRRLTFLQLDPTSAIAPNADLIPWSRLGSSYAPADLDTALESRALIELMALIRPAEDLVTGPDEQGLRRRRALVDGEDVHSDSGAAFIAAGSVTSWTT